MNIALLASYAAPYPGNFIPSVIFLNRKIKERGDKIVFVFPEETKDREWMKLFENEKVYFLPYAPYSPSTIKALRRLFKDEKIDVIYSHFCGWDISSRIAAPFTRNVWHCRMNVRTDTAAKKIKYFIKYRIVGSFKTFSMANTPAVGKKLLKIAGKKRSNTVCNGIDFSRLNIKKEYREEKKNVLLFGWQPFVKGLDTVCDAFENGIENASLTVSCQNATKEYLQKRYPQKLPQWLIPEEPTNNVSALYDNADIFLSASITEGFATALAEALYSGLPCVISNIEGTDWAWEMKNVFVFETGNPESLKAAIEKCKAEPMSFENAEYNRKIMLQKYSLETWSKKVMSALDGKPYRE